jgi:hypothetical protein
LSDHLAADVAGGSDDENPLHRDHFTFERPAGWRKAWSLVNAR